MDRHVQSLQYALNVLKRPTYMQYIKAIYLYGSCARAEQKYSSDEDLFLFLDEGTPDNLIRKMRSDVIPDHTLPEVEIKFSRSDIFSSSYHFNKNIERDAKLIWKRTL